MATRPRDLIYALDERPPLGVLMLSAVQHVAILVGAVLVLPLVVLDRSGVDAETMQGVLALALLALAISTFLQIRRRGWIGSGFLVPATFTAAYLPPALKAVEVGGLELVAGMLIFGGVCQMALAPLLRRLRPYLPTEIAGLAVLMIGIILGLLAIRIVFGIDDGGSAAAATSRGSLLGIAAFIAVVAASIYGFAHIRPYGILVGIVMASTLAALLGSMEMTSVKWALVEHGLDLPRPAPFVPAFDISLVPEFLVSSLASAVRAIGDLTTCQKINDAEWRRPELDSIRGGVMADGLGTAIAGAIGCPIGLNTFSGSVGLSAATGITSRYVGYGIVAVLVAMAVVPALTALVAAVPRQIMGGALFYTAVFITLNGAQVIISRMHDSRRTLTIGSALLLGLSYDVFPGLYRELAPWLAGLLASPLMVAVLTAILLNLMFRIGIHKRVDVPLGPAGERPDIYAEMDQLGGAWGARPEVIHKVAAALTEIAEHGDEFFRPDERVAATVAYDEFSISVMLSWEGEAIDLPAGQPATSEGLMNMDPDELAAHLRGRLLTGLADRTSIRSDAGRNTLRLHFEH